MKLGHLEPTFSSGKEKKIRIYPTLTINETDFPEIKNWKVDQVIEMKIKLKVTGISREKWSSEQKMSAQVDITEMEKGEEESYSDEYARRMSA
jgi:hypothetical protein